VKEKELNCWFDGCCEPRNPGGHLGYGAVIFEGEDRLWSHSGYITASPNNSNNVAEYRAFLSILERLNEDQYYSRAIHVRGDSKLVINQMFGSWRMKGGFYIPVAHEAQRLLERFDNITAEWIPREENSIADELSKRELKLKNVEFRIQPEV
jgi:ribonuclease HI